MSVKKFLRMMPQIDRRYLDEAYRVTAGRTTTKERGGIVKKVTKIAVAAALCVGVIAGGAALIWKLNSGGKPDVSPNPHGSGYVGNAPETVKFHAKLTKQPAEPSTQDVTWAAINAARLPGLDAIAYNKVYESNMQLSLSDKGRYFIGKPSEDCAHSGICYTDAATGKALYLCAKPECLHDGSDYCPATNSDYEFTNLIWYDRMLYATANKFTHSSDSLRPVDTVLLRIQPDGTGMDEIAVLWEGDSICDSELIAYRGALWVTGTLVASFGDDPRWTEDKLREDPTLLNGYKEQHYALWHYDLNNETLTEIVNGLSRKSPDFTNLQADGDYVYVYRSYSDDPAKPENGLAEGIWQIDARTGVMTRMNCVPLAPSMYMAAGGKFFWVTRTGSDTPDSYAMHCTENGEETVVSVPRGDRYSTDGEYLFIEREAAELTVCDMQGNVLRTERFLEGDRSENYAKRYGCACINGMLYCACAYVKNPGDVDWSFRAVPLADYISGNAGFTEFLQTKPKE